MKTTQSTQSTQSTNQTQKEFFESNKYALGIIEQEGIGYAVQDYCSGDGFKDPKTKELWKNAGKALNDLQNYLEKYVGDFYD